MEPSFHIEFFAMVGRFDTNKPLPASEPDVLTILNLLVTWAFLSGISYGILLLQMKRVGDWPLYFGKGSYAGGVPRLLYEPRLLDNVKLSSQFLIKFDMSKPESYKSRLGRYDVLREAFAPRSASPIKEANHTNGELLGDVYELPPHRAYNECSLGKSAARSISVLTSKTNMGFDTARPCVMLRLTKVLGFYPWDKMVQKNEPCQQQNFIFVCKLEHAGKRLDLNYYPNEGISFCHFPYWNQKDYTVPYVMVQPVQQLPTGKSFLACEPNLDTLKLLDNNAANKVSIIFDVSK